ncbi:MAG: hypothetical protein HDR24_13665 [Lachnospiraceae bacterium]|nr:hypothetical protein [Lachnospiraceae bacterium]
MNEVWKSISGYEGRYEVSNLGRVRSIPRYVDNHTGKKLIKEKIVSQHINDRGYVIVSLNKETKRKTYKVHRLVAEAFIENHFNKPQVNHIDGDKTNNRVENLEWNDNSENQRHAYRTGLNKPSGKSGKPKRGVMQLDVHGNEIGRFDSIARASVETTTSASNIGECCRGKRKSANGYKWRYG